MTQQNFPYKLQKLAEKWDRREDEILQLAAAGKITLSFWWAGNYWWHKKEIHVGNELSQPLNEFVNVEKEDIQYLISGIYVEEDGGVEISIVSRQNGEKIHLVISSQEENLVHAPIIKVSNLCVLPEELYRYEKASKVLHKKKGHNPDNTKLAVIGALLILLRENSRLNNQNQIKEAIFALSLNDFGLHNTTLSDIFSAANKLDSIKKYQNRP